MMNRNRNKIQEQEQNTMMTNDEASIKNIANLSKLKIILK